MLTPKAEYTAMLLGATGNVGGRILHLLVQSPLCRKVVVVTRRHVAELAVLVGEQLGLPPQEVADIAGIHCLRALVAHEPDVSGHP